MGDMADIWNAQKEQSKKKRASNRNQSATFLNNKEIMFSVKNGGAHLIVQGGYNKIDLWPSTGKWVSRDKNKTSGFGIRSLVRLIYKEEQEIEKNNPLRV